MNVRAIPAHVEFATDTLKNAQDEAQYQKEQRQALVHRRAEEIHAKRIAHLSAEDIAVALERLSTYPKCIALMRADLAISVAAFGETMAGLMRNALFTDSLSQAWAEFDKMDAEQGELN
jgi:hypothetical protein